MLLANAFENFIFNFFFFVLLMICWAKWMLAEHDKDGHVKGQIKGYAKRGLLNLLGRLFK